MKILDQLINIRKEKKITQKYMSQQIKVTQVTWNRYESGIREMPHSIMVKYADILGYEMKLMLK